MLSSLWMIIHATLGHCSKPTKMMPLIISKFFVKKVENEKNLLIKQIRSDHGTEFQNENFSNFCQEKGTGHNFSCPITPQQNGVVEKKIGL